MVLFAWLKQKDDLLVMGTKSFWFINEHILNIPFFVYTHTFYHTALLDFICKFSNILSALYFFKREDKLHFGLKYFCV